MQWTVLQWTVLQWTIMFLMASFNWFLFITITQVTNYRNDHPDEIFKILLESLWIIAPWAAIVGVGVILVRFRDIPWLCLITDMRIDGD